MTKSVTYTRTSWRPKGSTCQSSDVQLAHCERYCEEQGYEIVERCNDPEASGDDEGRPGLWAAITALPRGGVLVVHKQDRLARSVYLDEYIRRTVTAKRGRIEVVEGGHNGDSPHDVMVRQILAAVAEAEKKITAARTRAAMLHYQRHGRAMSAIPPYGQARGPDIETIDANGKVVRRRTWIECPEEQAHVKRILQLAGKQWPPAEIARRLNLDGLPCRGSTWTRRLVKRICDRDN
jgi:site-specific DNA recombinase